MTSQPGQRTIAIEILPNLLWSKGNQAMKLGKSIEYSKRNIILQKISRKWGRETSSRPLSIFLKKLNMRKKEAACGLVSVYFDSPQLCI